MVGDGVNDAPALATADVGISMGVSGSALATETGHVILMSNDIRRIPKVIRLAKRTQRKVIQNIVFSIATKAGVLAVAFAGHPIIWLAVLADVLTCLVVIFNSMTLLRGSHEHGAGKSNHAHGKKGTCSDSSASSLVHDHTSGVHKHSCSPNNVATGRFKTAKSSSLEAFCSSRKCSVDPLAHQHQHQHQHGVEMMKELSCPDESCSMKLVECQSCGDCCKSTSTPRECQKEDLEGQAVSCLGDDQAECCGEVHEEEIGGHDHGVAHKHGSCCKSFMDVHFARTWFRWRIQGHRNRITSSGPPLPCIMFWAALVPELSYCLLSCLSSLNARFM